MEVSLQYVRILCRVKNKYFSKGFPPLTYQMFLHTVNVIGQPPRPECESPDFSHVNFGKLPSSIRDNEFTFFNKVHIYWQLKLVNYKFLQQVPKPEDFKILQKNPGSLKVYNKWKGGEKNALEQLKLRLKVEEKAFTKGTYLPNQGAQILFYFIFNFINFIFLVNSNLINNSTSVSAALRFGCLSVRKFYYAIHDLFNKVQEKIPHKFPGGHHLTGLY